MKTGGRGRSPRILRRRVAALGALALVVSATGLAEAGEIRGFNTDGITIPAGAPGTTSGPSNPYPSELTVDWCQGIIQDVNVGFQFFSHGATADLDILLVGPGGQNALIASDSGHAVTNVSNLIISLDDEAITPLPAPWTDGTFQPTNVVGTSDSMDPPAPPAAGSFLSVFDGTNPNGTWRLFIDDQLGGDVGTMGSWSLTITVATTAPSGTGVCISHQGIAEPYPTTVTTSGLAAPIQDVDVTLNGLAHERPDDLDILLAGAGGRNVMLMSDAGGLSNDSVNLTFDDEAAAPLPDTDPPPLATGSYKPTNFLELENLPAPAPATQGISLGTFDGLDPNGTWSLFLRDDGLDYFGTLQSWSLQITTPGFTVSPAKAKEGKKAIFTVTRTGDLGQANTATFATAPGSAKPKDFKALSGTLSFAAGDATEQVVVKTKNDNKDEKKNERFSLNLTSGQATFTGTGKVTDTDK